MSVDALLEALRQEDAEAVRKYVELVKLIADGREIKPQRVREVLAAARRSPEDLRRDVALASRRNEWRAALARLPELESQLAEIRSKLAAADRELEEAAARHRALHAELVPQRERLRAEIAQARDAARALVTEFIADDRVGTKLLAARAELETATHRVAELRAEYSEAERQARSAKVEAERAARPGRWIEESERAARRAARLKAALVEAEAGIAALEQRVIALEQQARGV